MRFAFLSLALLCGAVNAQLAYTGKTVNLRAGPARDFPVVAVLPAGYRLSVQGCLSDYTWCDVVAGDLRGWVYAGNINYPWQNGYAPVITWGPLIGIGIIGFALDDYWSRHYWSSPWYPERHRWAGRQWPVPRPHVRPHWPPGPPLPDGAPPPVRPAPFGGPHGPDGRPPHGPRPDGRAPREPQPPRQPPPGQRPPGHRPPGIAPGDRPPGHRPPGIAPGDRPQGPSAPARPYVAPGSHRPPGAGQPQPQPGRPRGTAPRALPDNGGRGQPKYP